MSEPRIPMACWDGDEAAYAEALANTGRHIAAGEQRHERLAEAKEETRPGGRYVRVQRNVLAEQKPRTEPVPAAERAEMARLYREIGEQPDVCRLIAARLDPPHSTLCVATILVNDGVCPKKLAPISRKSRSPSDPISDAELSQMIELYREIGERKGVCERIAARLNRRRSPQCVGIWLHKVGERPLAGRR